MSRKPFKHLDATTCDVQGHVTSSLQVKIACCDWMEEVTGQRIKKKNATAKRYERKAKLKIVFTLFKVHVLHTTEWKHLQSAIVFC